MVLVPFPFAEQTATKKRPAVVASSAAYNNARPDLGPMAVTSQVRTVLTFGGVLGTQWRAAGLIKPSVIKPIFTTIDKSLVLRSLGRLQPADAHALLKELPNVLG